MVYVKNVNKKQSYLVMDYIVWADHITQKQLTHNY